MHNQSPVSDSAQDWGCRLTCPGCQPLPSRNGPINIQLAGREVPETIRARPQPQ
jgi:hypothetical protein